MMRWARLAACIGDIINGHKNVTGIPEGEKPPWKHKHVWEYNIEMYP